MGKRVFMCGERRLELDSAVMSRGRALHPVAISDVAFQVVGGVQVGDWRWTSFPTALYLI